LVQKRTVTYDEALSKASDVKEFNSLVGDANPNIVRDAKGRVVATA
jgi:hypothetical protein